MQIIIISRLAIFCVTPVRQQDQCGCCFICYWRDDGRPTSNP